MRRPSASVYRRGQRVEHHDVVPEREEPVAGVRADEPRTAGDEDLHDCLWPPALGDLAVDVKGRSGCGSPGELAGPA